MIGIQNSNRKLPFFCEMENANACASAALRDGEKSLKCIGFLDGKGVVFVKLLKVKYLSR